MAMVREANLDGCITHDTLDALYGGGGGTSGVSGLKMATGKMPADTGAACPRPWPKFHARTRARHPPWAPSHARARYPPACLARGHARVPARSRGGR